MKILYKYFFIFFFYTSCKFGAGTLGGFDTSVFPTKKKNVVIALDSLFIKYPKYKIPSKWLDKDDWIERGFGFLDTRIFYFSDFPEEMYYVSFLGNPSDSVRINSNTTGLAIRAVANEKEHWRKESETNYIEKKRIEDRFDKEIISKLEKYTNTKSIRED